MIYEELGLSPQTSVLMVVTLVFLFWLIRYADGLKREVYGNRRSLEGDMQELEDVAKKLENDLDELFKRLDAKVDQSQLELKLDELERKRAELIKKAVELKNKAQASIELIAIFTLLLLPIVAGFIYAYSSISDSMSYKADVALDRLSATAERLYVEGPGATASVVVDLPSGIDHASSYIGSPSGGEGRYLSLNVSGSEAFRILNANVSGNWQNTSSGNVRAGQNVFNLTVSSSGCVGIVPR
jgi:hypothetical protein